MLFKKLFRDMRKSAMQFAALILLCMLGVFLFAAIDSFGLITQASNDSFFHNLILPSVLSIFNDYLIVT